MPKHLLPVPSGSAEPANREHRRHPHRLAYSPAEFAEATGVCLAHVHNLIRRGELRSVKLGRRRVILAAELDRLAADQSGGDAA